MEFHKHVLANGLEIVAECNAEAHSTALGFFVETGARDETDEISGVSHFLEHMVFKGTPTRSADDVNREFDEMGAHYNAFTSEENTVYYAAVLPEYQTSATELLADIIRPSLREEDFDTEKQVIIEEIRMYDDQPPFGADEKCKALHFGRHPLGRSVLGTVQSITDLRVDAMREYFQRRYSPGNMTLAAAGRIDFAMLVKTAERHLRPLGAGGHRARRTAGPAPPGLRVPAQGHRHARIRAATGQRRPRRKTPTASPPRSWPRSSATTRAAGSTGHWSTTGWPSRPRSAITTIKAPACS